MADGFLETHREEYEKRKAEWLRRRRLKIHRRGTPCGRPKSTTTK
ncbi:MAG: dehydrogenase [Prevotellaceae bacterium]|nr:dehydrogenase [Prevotellaceae bacterium]